MTMPGGTMGRLDDALMRLRTVAARPGCTGEEVAAEARAIAADWWLDVQVGATPPERLHPLVGELRRWCLAVSNRDVEAWDTLERAGSSQRAEDARRRAEALGRAAEELRRYE